jgi:hypothetical protein
MKLLFRPYLRYKFFNSLFTGVVGGSVFTIYSGLSPSTFSAGGIVLALSMMGMAYLYHHIMRLEYFFRFSLLAEIIMLLMVSYFLIFSLHSDTALIIYGAYQLSFILGGYLVRAETHFAKHARIMGWIDIVKQQGYLAGLTLSYGFYKFLEHYGINDAHMQVYYLHFFLFILEVIVIGFLIKGFQKQ